MDLLIKQQLFIVCGASSGFGRAIAETLAAEGAQVIAIARGADKLQQLAEMYPTNIAAITLDITDLQSHTDLQKIIAGRQVHGILLNAGGPPAKSALETNLDDWDNAYKSLLRWKVNLLHLLMPSMIENKYGRVIFVESASVKQPIENLVLSNSLRLAAVGYAKTLSQEVARYGITINVMAPGSHNTNAMERIYLKKAELTGMSKEEAAREAASKTSVGFIGDAADFASLAAWLFSPHSRYINGQTISVDGGSIKGIMG